MRVLHLSGKDFFGAGRAAYRLHKALRTAGVDSWMWVGSKTSRDETVINIKQGWINLFLRKLNVKREKCWLRGKDLTNQMFSSGRFALSIVDKINAFNPDVVHLHWINRGFMNLNDLKKIKAPIVITMHDMWYYTGGCHISGTCEKYKEACGQCPQLQSKIKEDKSSELWHFKKEVYNASKPKFIAPSRWMKEQAGFSQLLAGMLLMNLPNCIDTNYFKAIDSAKQKLGFSKKKHLILFAAVDALSDRNKGYDLLQKSLSHLDVDTYELLILGEASLETMNDFGQKVHNPGYVSDESELINYLSAADIVVVPSRQENLSNMIMESLTCGTPVVAFNVGGNSDMIDHQNNGYLAKSFDANDLAKGITWCTADADRHDLLSLNARQSVQDKFDSRIISTQFINMYQQQLK